MSNYTSHTKKIIYVVGASRHGFGQAERGEFKTVNLAWIRLLLIWPELSDDQRMMLLESV